MSLTPEQLERLRELAAARGVSVATLVREGVDLLTAGPTAEQRRTALQAVGAFGSGERHTSRDHDSVLADIYAG